MTRRKFIKKLINTGVMVMAGAWCLAQKTIPRKFIRAVKSDSFPGSLKPLRDIKSESKWSG
jgi:hypothetical protein